MPKDKIGKRQPQRVTLKLTKFLKTKENKKTLVVAIIHEF